MELSNFKEFEGQEYHVLTGDGSSISLKLIELKELPKQTHPDIREFPFSLLFEGPSQPILPPLRYALTSPNSSKIELFLQAVVGSGDKANYYESIFN